MTQFLTTPRLEWQVVLKKTKVNLDPLADNQYLIKSRKYQRKRYQRRNMSLYSSI